MRRNKTFWGRSRTGVEISMGAPLRGGAAPENTPEWRVAMYRLAATGLASWTIRRNGWRPMWRGGYASGTACGLRTPALSRAAAVSHRACRPGARYWSMRSKPGSKGLAGRRRPDTPALARIWSFRRMPPCPSPSTCTRGPTWLLRLKDGAHRPHGLLRRQGDGANPCCAGPRRTAAARWC